MRRSIFCRSPGPSACPPEHVTADRPCPSLVGLGPRRRGLDGGFLTTTNIAEGLLTQADSLLAPGGVRCQKHCGSCAKCIEVCPTQAIRGPYRLDARRCISYLTIELKGAIPEELRPLVGNRVYGCDDCQLACPWNSFAQASTEADFAVRNGLDAGSLVELFGWSAGTFDARMAGSAIRRIGYERWLRNLAVGLGNAPASPEVIGALRARADDTSALVREHVQWALGRHGA